MDPSTALNTSVLLWIFGPLLLIGIVGWFTTPNPLGTQEERVRAGANEMGFGAAKASLASR